MRTRITWTGLLYSIALSFHLAAIVLFLTLGWTLDTGVRLLDLVLPFAAVVALACVVARIRYGKAMLVTAIVLSFLYFMIVRQSIVLR